MKAEATKEVQAKAPECTKDCGCLKPGGEPNCTVSGTVDGTILFTQTRASGGCTYQHSFGSSFICTCPVRKELFEKHNI